MRAAVGLAIALLTICAWLASERAMREHQAAVEASLHKADFPICVTIHNGPLGPQPTAKNPYPRRNDSA